MSISFPSKTRHRRILDWESFGWYPSFCEYTFVYRGAVSHTNSFRLVEDELHHSKFAVKSLNILVNLRMTKVNIFCMLLCYIQGKTHVQSLSCLNCCRINTDVHTMSLDLMIVCHAYQHEGSPNSLVDTLVSMLSLIIGVFLASRSQPEH